MARQLLVELRCWVRREGRVDDLLSNAIPGQLRSDIVLWIKATGSSPPVFEPRASVLDMLVSFVASTDQTKMSPGEPNPRALGLLRDKVTYARPEVKAEKIIKNGGTRPVAADSDNDSGNAVRKSSVSGSSDGPLTEDRATSEESTGGDRDSEEREEGGGAASSDDPRKCIPNSPLGSATAEEYRKGLLAIDGLSLLFGRSEFTGLVSHTDACTTNDKETATPIGFKLHRYSCIEQRSRIGS